MFKIPSGPLDDDFRSTQDPWSRDIILSTAIPSASHSCTVGFWKCFSYILIRLSGRFTPSIFWWLSRSLSTPSFPTCKKPIDHRESLVFNQRYQCYELARKGFTCCQCDRQLATQTDLQQRRMKTHLTE